MTEVVGAGDGMARRGGSEWGTKDDQFKVVAQDFQGGESDDYLNKTRRNGGTNGCN